MNGESKRPSIERDDLSMLWMLIQLLQQTAADVTRSASYCNNAIVLLHACYPEFRA